MRTADAEASIPIDTMTTANANCLSQLKQKIETREVRTGIVGMGYVGLPLALLFSGERFQVTGFDIA